MKYLTFLLTLPLAGCVSLSRHNADIKGVIAINNRNVDTMNENSKWISKKIFEINQQIDKINDALRNQLMDKYKNKLDGSETK